MARVQKQNLEYFRHYAKTQGKTMDTLQLEHGNDGYAFWFKLLEILAQQDGHFYDCNSVANWRYLASNARVSQEKAEEIMNLLSDFEAIDQQLWQENRIIWVQKLVDNAADVYEKRKSQIPQKPCFRDGNDSATDISVTEMAQSKVKESKVKESKEKTSKKEKVVLTDSRVDFLVNQSLKDGEVKQAFYAYLEMRKNKGKRYAVNTEYCLNLCLTKLRKLAKSKEQAIEILNYSIQRNYEGLFDIAANGSAEGLDKKIKSRSSDCPPPVNPDDLYEFPGG